MSEDSFEWTEYANNPDDGATIINLIKENESLKSELEQLKKRLNKAVELIRFINSRDCPSGINKKTDLF